MNKFQKSNWNPQSQNPDMISDMLFTRYDIYVKFSRGISVIMIAVGILGLIGNITAIIVLSRWIVWWWFHFRRKSNTDVVNLRFSKRWFWWLRIEKQIKGHCADTNVRRFIFEVILIFPFPSGNVCWVKLLHTVCKRISYIYTYNKSTLYRDEEKVQFLNSRVFVYF